MARVIRAGTWNIHEGIPVSGPGPVSAHELIDQLSESPVDVLALQEVPFDDTGHSPLLRAIEAHSALRHVSGFPLSQASYHQGFRSGVAIVSRLPHSVESRLLLPNPRLRFPNGSKLWESWDKGMIVATINMTGVPIWVASIHCCPFHKFGRHASDEEFTYIWRKLADAIDQIPGPVIIGGDFNTDSRDPLTRELNQISLSSIFSGMDTHDGKSVDDILHDSEIISKSREVIRTFSDHSFCRTELALGPLASREERDA